MITEICHHKGLQAAVNFQLRFSAVMLALRDAFQRGLLGEICEIELHLNVHTPWKMFPFLKEIERVELLVHYIDLIRSIVGDPHSIMCHSMVDPRSEAFRQTRTSAILDFEYSLRCLMSINHNYG